MSKPPDQKSVPRYVQKTHDGMAEYLRHPPGIREQKVRELFLAKYPDLENVVGKPNQVHSETAESQRALSPDVSTPLVSTAELLLLRPDSECIQ